VLKRDGHVLAGETGVWANEKREKKRIRSANLLTRGPIETTGLVLRHKPADLGGGKKKKMQESVYARGPDETQ